MEKIKSKKIYAIYTALFIFITCIVFGIFFINNRTFIWQADGLKQHYIILKDFNNIIRSFLKTPKDGIRLFSWNMGLGLDVIGQYSYYVLGDPFAYISLLFPMEKLESAYNFLVLLRLFFVGISFIVYAKYNSKSQDKESFPKECQNKALLSKEKQNKELLYKENKQSQNKASLSKENKVENNKNILLGAIIYTFSSFSLFAGVRHPYFLNAMILFPLLLLGIDKLLKENKKIFLCVFVTISALSNYYFFYMHTILIIIYAIIKYFCEYKEEGIKSFFKKLGSGIIIYIIGILIASIILLPTIYAFLNSARSGEKTICQYNLDYYKSLFSINLLTAYGENWSYIGVASIVLIALPILFSRIKENKVYFIYLLITTIFLLVPFLGSGMNGFSFPNNRWAFAYSFILSYIVTICFDEYSQKEIRNICIFLALYSLVAIVALLITPFKSAFIIYIIQILLSYIMLAVIYCKNRNNIESNIEGNIGNNIENNVEGNIGNNIENNVENNIENNVENNKESNIEATIKTNIKNRSNNMFYLLMYGLVIFSIGVMAYDLYSSYDRNYAEEFVKANNSNEVIETQLGKNKNYEKSINSILEKDKTKFYRIAKLPHNVQNLSIYSNYPSTECFLSIGNKYVYNLSKELADNSFSTTSCIRGMGDRAKITTILGTKYYIADEKNKNSVPYGYKLKEKIEEVNTYENENALSIGISYSKYMLRENYEKLNPLEKEDALTKVAVIDNKKALNGIKVEEKENLQDVHNCVTILPIKIKDDDKILTKNINDNGNDINNRQNNINANDNENHINNPKNNINTEDTVSTNSKSYKTIKNNEKNIIKTSKKNQKLILTFPEVKNSEVYVLIKGFNFEGNAQHTIKASFKEKSASKTIENKITSAYYEKCTEILLPLGYYEKAKGDISLNFSTKGTYKFEEIQVLAVSMENYEKTMQELKEGELKLSKCNNKEIAGTVEIKENSILQIVASYTTGWKAYVDGKQVDTIRVNTAFIGVTIEAGKHNIEFKYEVPYLKEGVACTITGIFLFIILCVLEKRKFKN